MDVQLTFVWLLAERLSEAGIRYMITGPLAESLYGPPLLARSIDVLIELSAATVDRFVGLFADDCVVDRDAVEPAVSSGGAFSMVHAEWIVKADFTVAVGSSDDVEALDRRRWLEVNRFRIAVAAGDDLPSVDRDEAAEAPGVGAELMQELVAEGEEERRQRLMQLGPVERFTIACRMFTTAQRVLRARIPATDEADIRRQVFLLLYGRDITDDGFRERAADEVAARSGTGAGST